MKKFGIVAVLIVLVTILTVFCSCNENVLYTIYFNVDGVIYDTITTTDSNAIIIPENPTKEGYEFSGWFWDKDIWEKPFTANSLLDAPISSDITVYAGWVPEGEETQNTTYNVTFDTLGGSKISMITLDAGATITLPANPTKDGFVFGGWFTDAECTVLATTLLSATISSSFTLYAGWVPEGVILDLPTPSRPNYSSAITSADRSIINAGLDNGATEAEIEAAVIALYNVANTTKQNADYLLAVSGGDGSATMMGITGYMTVRAFKAQYGDAFYYQKAAKLVRSSASNMVTSILENALDLQERNYYCGTGDNYLYTKLKGGSSDIESMALKDFPFVEMNYSENDKKNKAADYEEFAENNYVLDDPNELSNFCITVDGIKDATIEYNEIEKYYTIHYAIEIDNEETVSVPRQYLRDSSDSIENLEYSKFEIDYQIWDNGYVKYAYDEEGWEAKMNLLGGGSGGSSSWYETQYYWSANTELLSAEYQADWTDTKAIINYFGSIKDWVTAKGSSLIE